MSENALRFENIELASGDSGAREGHGLKRTRGYYVTDSHYGIGTTANDTLTTAVRDKLTKDHGLDCIIIRKTDRKAIRLTIASTTASHYKTINSGNTGTTIKEITTFDGLWTPELGRLRNQGQI